MTQTEQLIEIRGRPVVLAYSGVANEYAALRRKAIVVNRGHRARMRFDGDKSGDVLNGLVTNDVAALTAGQGLYAAALTPKGKILADLRILRLDDGFLADVSARAADGWSAMIRKYVNPRLSRYSDVSDELSSLGVYGTQARYVVEELTGIGHSALALLQPYAHVSVKRDDGTLVVMRSPDLGLEGFDIFAPSSAFQAVWDAAVNAHATPAGHGAWEIARVEAGRPEWGVDIDDSTLVQEANFDELGAISYTKGCYTGQEVVARVHFRGHVNRNLRGARTGEAAPPPQGAELFDEIGKSQGKVLTSVNSPRLGGIALVMVRRDVLVGGTLTARWAGDPAGDIAAGDRGVEINTLPFPLE